MATPDLSLLFLIGLVSMINACVLGWAVVLGAPRETTAWFAAGCLALALSTLTPLVLASNASPWWAVGFNQLPMLSYALWLVGVLQICGLRRHAFWVWLALLLVSLPVLWWTFVDPQRNERVGLVAASLAGLRLLSAWLLWRGGPTLDRRVGRVLATVLLVEALTMANRALSAWSGEVPPIGTDAHSASVLTWITMLASALLSTPLLMLLGLGRMIGDLRYRNALLQHLVAASPIGILLSELDGGRLREANPSFLAQSGHPSSALASLRYADLFASEHAHAEVEELLRREQCCGPLELEWLRADGALLPVRLAAVVVIDPRQRRLVWSLVEDISEPQRIQRAKSELVAVVSHELRTPLTALMGAVSLLAGTSGDRLDEASRKLLQIALGNGQRLHQLVDDLLDFDRLVAGRLRFHLQPQPLRPLMVGALDANRTSGAERSISLLLRDPVPEIAVNVDGPRLLQVLGNLLSNAIKFSPHGASVELMAEEVEDGVSIRVLDRGPGVPEAFRGQLFERFTQADASDRRERGGSGLGLAIAKEMVERMGGSIDYQPATGGGACFSVVLPRA